VSNRKAIAQRKKPPEAAVRTLFVEAGELCAAVGDTNREQAWWLGGTRVSLIWRPLPGGSKTLFSDLIDPGGSGRGVLRADGARQDQRE
jgi:hypothetical protein